MCERIIGAGLLIIAAIMYAILKATDKNFRL